LLIAPGVEDTREEAQRARLTDQLRTYDPDGRWTTEISLGRPAEVIVDFATGKGADLIVVGANGHSMLGRFLGEDTAMEIARLTDIPLLVASPEMYRLPRRVTVAMDLNAGGLETVPDVLPMIADTPSIICVHVKSRAEWMALDSADFERAYECAMNDRFDILGTALSEVHLRPDLVVLHGETVDELIDYAARSKTELIVVGVKRRRGRSKAIGGRIAGRILRRARSSVLIVPGSRSENAVLAPASGTTSVAQDRGQWDAALREFSARNAGRIADIEVDDPEIGALVEATGYPLVGVDYDHKDGRISIMFGDSHGTERHFTRSISRPESLSVLQVDGRDKALSVKHGSGQTLLRF
jgi:nucleotide-binding universal stress UspA family protein